MAARIIPAILGIFLLTAGAGWCDDKLNVAVSHPWLALIASFIGGPEVSVTPLRVWNANGDLVVAERGKIFREIPDGAKIIALDENDAKNSGIKSPEKYTVKYLYSPFPVSTSSLYDPSVIPFVAQRVLTALSEWDSQNYPYYQRRLAEFQSLTLMDDAYMRLFFKDNIPCVQLVLRIIMNKDDLIVKSAKDYEKFGRDALRSS